MLSDADGILVQQTANVQAARQLRFKSQLQIIEMEAVIKSYIYEAVAIEKAGLKVELKKTVEFSMPAEFECKLNAIPTLKEHFEALTPGRQRAYLLYFSSAKQAATREARIEKYMPKIVSGKGLDDD